LNANSAPSSLSSASASRAAFEEALVLRRIMGIFRKQPDSDEPRYTLDDMRSDIGKAIEKARAARIHPIEIERAVHASADWLAQHRALNSAII
jgi:hypothetical protein